MHYQLLMAFGFLFALMNLPGVPCCSQLLKHENWTNSVKDIDGYL